MKAPNPPDLPSIVAKNFAVAMRDYFVEEDQAKRDAVAAHQLKVLARYQNRRDGKPRLSDIKSVFEAMKGLIG